MRESSQRYIVALHEIIHTILSEEAGQINRQTAFTDHDATARIIPRLHRD